MIENKSLISKRWKMTALLLFAASLAVSGLSSLSADEREPAREQIVRAALGDDAIEHI